MYIKQLISLEYVPENPKKVQEEGQGMANINALKRKESQFILIEWTLDLIF